MTNRVFEKELTATEQEIMGLVKCSSCERITAWETCVMCLPLPEQRSCDCDNEYCYCD